jgi:hypothetical protein
MGADLKRIQVSDCLGSPGRADELLAQVATVPAHGGVVLDAAAVSFVCPYGAALLLSVCRQLERERGRPVELVGLQQAVHAYLARVDFFKAGFGSVIVDRPLQWHAELTRTEASLSVLELTLVRSAREVYDTAGRAFDMCKAWLGLGLDAARDLAQCVAEACGNVVDHSQDRGLVVAQKYEFPQWTELQLAIADLGIGVRRSLADRYTELNDTPAGWIKRAVAGLSRRGEQGGVGLGEIRRLALRSGGTLLVRSETGRVLYARDRSREAVEPRDGLARLPGTQLAVTLRRRRL